MHFTPADVAHLQFSEDGSHVTAYVVFVSHDRPDGEHHLGITIDVPLTVSPDESIADLRARAVATIERLLGLKTLPSNDPAMRKELQRRVNRLIARPPEQWPARWRQGNGSGAGRRRLGAQPEP